MNAFQSMVEQQNQERDIFKNSPQLNDSDGQIQNDRVDLLSPWSIKKYPLRAERYSNHTRIQQKHYYSIQMPSLLLKPQLKKQDPKVSFRLTFNSLRTRRTPRQYASLDAQLRKQKEDIQMIKARRHMIKGPKLLHLDINLDLESKKAIKKHNERMHKFDHQNQKMIQLNPYHRNRKKNSKQLEKNNHANQKKQKYQHEELNSKPAQQRQNQINKLKIISFDQVIKSTQERPLKTGTTCKDRQGPLLKNYKIERIIKSEKQANNSFYNAYTKKDKFLFSGDLLNSSTLHSTNRQRLRKIGAVREYLNNREQQQLNSYLNKTMFVG